ncbi:hypothetical protein PAENIP36_53800 [Paenibacillus sp. P36]
MPTGLFAGQPPVPPVPSHLVDLSRSARRTPARFVASLTNTLQLTPAHADPWELPYVRTHQPILTDSTDVKRMNIALFQI